MLEVHLRGSRSFWNKKILDCSTLFLLFESVGHDSWHDLFLYQYIFLPSQSKFPIFFKSRRYIFDHLGTSGITSGLTCVSIFVKYIYIIILYFSCEYKNIWVFEEIELLHISFKKIHDFLAKMYCNLALTFVVVDHGQYAHQHNVIVDSKISINTLYSLEHF